MRTNGGLSGEDAVCCGPVDAPDLSVERAVAHLIASLGLDPTASELVETPRRVAATFREMLHGLAHDEKEPLGRGDSVPAAIGLVALTGIEFRSLCVHHLLPFSGFVDVVYEPGARLLGIGSIAGSIEILSSRPQLQEHLADQLAAALIDGGGASGVFVKITARHSCVADRGPRAVTTALTSSAALGSLADAARQNEVFNCLNSSRGLR